MSDSNDDDLAANLRRFAWLFVVPGGAAAIGWQLLWQHHAALALGVSAQATALVIATTMIGMTSGALLAARWLPRFPGVNPWLIYGGLELFVAISGNLFGWLQGPISRLDAAVFQSNPALAPVVVVASAIVALGPATLAIGATAPVLGLLGRELGVPMSRIYAINTAGAAIGAIWFSFLEIPWWGVSGCAWGVTNLQFYGALGCWMLSRKLPRLNGTGMTPEPSGTPVSRPYLVAFSTGLVTFLLEVTWFRSIRSAWLSTVDSFAIVLFAFLIALAAGAWMAPLLRRRGVTLPVVLAIGAMAIVAATLGIERFDLIRIPADNLPLKLALWLALALATMGPPVALLGTSLPWLFDSVRDPRSWSRLYAWNTLGCALGAIGAGWLLLPLWGPAELAIKAGLLLGILFFVLLKRFPEAAMMTFLSLVLPYTPRLSGASQLLHRPHRVVATDHGPDVTTSVIEANGGRALIIDGYAASGEFGAATSYMDAMGRLPMLLHEAPKDALVICFGTGQTAHALRDENAASVTAVDVNPAVFRLAPNFPANREVLSDARVQAITMDGRAWLRRTDRRYDVITLEPMPPMFTGTNALYSVEFYRLIAARLRADGIAAQWFPMHLLSPENARSVAAAFIEVFPNAVLWIDPSNADPQGTPQQGVLLGCAGDRDWQQWPGFARSAQGARPLAESTCRSSITLWPDGLRAYALGARPVSDDNLLLTHGRDRHLPRKRGTTPARQTMELIREYLPAP